MDKQRKKVKGRGKIEYCTVRRLRDWRGKRRNNEDWQNVGGRKRGARGRRERERKGKFSGVMVGSGRANTVIGDEKKKGGVEREWMVGEINEVKERKKGLKGEGRSRSND